MLKKGITSAMECADVAAFDFRYVTNKIVFTLQVYFGRSDSLFSFPSIFRIFREK